MNLLAPAGGLGSDLESLELLRKYWSQPRGRESVACRAANCCARGLVVFPGDDNSFPSPDLVRHGLNLFWMLPPASIEHGAVDYRRLFRSVPRLSWFRVGLPRVVCDPFPRDNKLVASGRALRRSP
jgi:hypothetical protein